MEDYKKILKVKSILSCIRMNISAGILFFLALREAIPMGQMLQEVILTSGGLPSIRSQI